MAPELRVTRTARLLGQSLDVLLWVFMGALASFTLALHLGVLTGVGLGAIAAAAVCCGIGLALAYWLWWRRAHGAVSALPDKRATATRPTAWARLEWVAAGCGVAAVLAVGAAVAGGRTDAAAAWLIAWGAAVAAVALGLALPLARSRLIAPPVTEAEPSGQSGRAPQRVPGDGFAVVTSMAAAVLAAALVRPDADDVFYVNRSAWVAELGTIPTRDTIFSDQVFAGLEGYRTPSWEIAWGLLARVLGVAGATSVYLLSAPLVAGLGVWALWRLIGHWQLARPRTGLALAALFLVFGGSVLASYGNFALARTWQGKAVLVAVLVPLLVAWTTRWVREGGARPLAAVAVLAVAATGLSTTSAMLVPAMGVAAAACAAWRRGPLALGGLLAFAYPLVALAGPLAAPASYPAALAQVDPIANVVKVFGDGGTLLIAAAAATLGLLAVRGSVERLVAGALVFGWLVSVGPGVLNVLENAAGAGPILWRAVWIVPLPALVGALGSLPAPRWPAFPGIAAGVAIAAAAVPVWDAANGSSWGPVSGSWKVIPATRPGVEDVLAATPGKVVLLPTPWAQTLASATASVHGVLPRADYVVVGQGDPAFRAEDRVALQALADGQVQGLTPQGARSLLDDLAVDTACVSESSEASRQLMAEAWGPSGDPAAAGLACWRSPATRPPRV